MAPPRIVDAHHHLWDLQACHYPWLMAKGVKRFFGDPTPIQKNYLASDFIADHGSLNITKSVHIQVGTALEDSIAETQWLDEQSKSYGFPNAVVGFVNLTDPDRDFVLDEHSRFSTFKGIRQIVGRDADEDRKSGTNTLISDPAFLTGLKTLRNRNLSFDLQLTPPLLKDCAKLLSKIEELPVALCHCGSLNPSSQDAISEWKIGLIELAKLPNILCKISGFGMFDHDWTQQSIREHVLTVIDIFGPDRVAFGSNFPVDKLYATYEITMNSYLELTKQFSNTERTQMFASNAEKFYRI